MISDRNLAMLAARLQIPLVVSNILDGEEILDEAMHYSLHEYISNLPPDSALLALALSARAIAARFERCSVSMKVLARESDRILTAYGSLWIQNARDQRVDQQAVMEVLDGVAQDLESLGELLDLNESFLRPVRADAAALCEILYVQALSQAAIADDLLRGADEQAGDDAFAPEMASGSNVIPFPIYRAEVMPLRSA
ncbi:MAG: hypothetical protein K9G62_08685 [Alphaproteobacteria bacterium]|nr:hypothetical protein [Alphaproteobacteria bacterium]